MAFERDLGGPCIAGTRALKNSNISRKNLSGFEQSRVSSQALRSMPRLNCSEGATEPLPALELR